MLVAVLNTVLVTVLVIMVVTIASVLGHADSELITVLEINVLVVTVASAFIVAVDNNGVESVLTSICIVDNNVLQFVGSAFAVAVDNNGMECSIAVI